MGRVIFQEVIDDLIEYAWVVAFMVSLPLAIVLWRKFQQWRLRRAAGNELESPYEAFYKSETEYLREGLSELLTVTRFGGFWLIFQVIVTLIALVQYIVETYISGTRVPFLAYMELLTTLVFTADFVLFFLASSNRLSYVISPLAITDQLTVLPVYVALARGTFWLATNSFFRPLRVIRAGRISQVYRLLALSRTSVQRQLVTVILTVAVLVFLGAAIIQIVESIGDQGQLLEFHQAVYFIVVTFTTVGYGDFTPKTTQGQLVMILMIVIGFFMVSYQSGRLINLLSSRSAYEGAYSSDSLHPHIVIAGDITYNSVVYFFKELFHRSRQADKLRVVFMTKKEPPLDLKILLEHPFYNSRVRYFVGSVLNAEDQRRAALSEAVACFIMNNKFRASDVDSDSEVILRALSVKEHAIDVPVVVQLHRKRSGQYLKEASIDVIVPMDEIRMLILGQNCMAPGFSTLISNLVHTFSPRQDSIEFRHLWAEEYYKGCTNQFYNVRFSEKFRGVRFTTVVQQIYSISKCILFAIQTEKPDSGDALTLLNPGRSYHLGGGEIGIVIGTHDAASRLVELMETFEPDEWEPESKKSLKRDSNDDLNDDRMIPLESPSSPKGRGLDILAAPSSPTLHRNPLASSGATFRRVNRRKSSRKNLHKTDLGLFVEVDDETQPAEEEESGFTDPYDDSMDDMNDHESVDSARSSIDSPREAPASDSLSFPPPRPKTPPKPDTPIVESHVIETADASPGGFKRPKRSLSTGPRSVTAERDVLTTMNDDIRRSSLLESPLSSSTAFAVAESAPAIVPAMLQSSSGLRTSRGTNSSSELKKSVHFEESVTELPNASGKKLTLGDRLKLIKAQTASRASTPQLSTRDALRRASVDVDRVQNRGSSVEAPPADDYASTISTDQPFARELAQLRADLRKSDFKREKFVAPVTESISTVLFDSQRRPRTKTSDDGKGTQPETFDRLSQNYYLLPTPRKTKDFVVTGKDYMFTHTEEHILICGEASKRSFIHLLTPLRSSKLGSQRLRPVVFLHSNLPSAYELKIMSQYPEVYFVEGSMLSEFDLRRAGIKSAMRVVLLTTQEKGSVEKTELIDSNVIFAFRNISLQFPQVEFVVAEMVEGPNMRFLDVGQAFQDRTSRLKRGMGMYNTLVQVMRESRTSDDWTTRTPSNKRGGRRWTNVTHLTQWFQSRTEDYSVLDYPEYHFRPLFAGGHVWAASMVDSLFAQIMYNPSLLNIVRLLAGGSPDPEYFSESSNMFQVSVPAVNPRLRRFRDLFGHFVPQGIVPIALYRSHSASECTAPYVYTNPDPDTALEPADRVFVLALHDPDESQDD